MPYNSIISRTDAADLIPETVSREIIQGAVEQSAFLRLARRLQNMPTNQTKMPVLSLFPTAYFVTGDNGLKQTSEVNWSNKTIDAEEIACIVPIPESVLADSAYDIWGEVKPRVVEAVGKALDAAVFFGTNAPASWPDDIRTAAVAAANNVAIGGVGDLYDDLLGDGGVISKVEADGFMVNGHVAAIGMRSRLRAVRDTAGQPLFMRSMQQAGQYELDGAPILFPRNGGFSTATTWMFCGDFSQFVYSIRQDMTFKLLDQAVIQDGAGAIVYNLAQQDMVALRCVIRLGWQCPNPINQLQATEASRYPVGVLTT
ncbi:MAG: phage major capsid protein [Acidobacteria bacterium]|nr:phage major capsid protein [Acidobacteriota bacterium]